MLKDAPQLEIDANEMIVAITPSDKGDNIWDCHLINTGNATYENVLINSKGYGEVNGVFQTTTSFRHFVEQLAPQTAHMVEVMPDELFQLTNEFWVSCNLNGQRYDKKFVFKQGQISSDNFTNIPVVNVQGVSAN